MERAELLCDKDDGKRKSWILLSLLVGVVAPILGVVPVLFALEKDEEDDPSREGLRCHRYGWVAAAYVHRFLSLCVRSFH